MRILITGGSGFIGAKIARQLAASGHDVCSLDARPPKPCQTATPEQVHSVEGNIHDPGSCHKAVLGAEMVIHSAATHLATKVSRQPLQSIQTNVHGTLNLLNAAANAKVRRFVFLSSAKVYGEPTRLPSSEVDFARPYDSYSLSKMMCEHYCDRFRQETTMETVSVRPFSVYGPDQDLETGYVGMLVRALLEDEDPAFPGQPDFLRDFVHINDVVEVLTRVVHHEGPVPPVLNAGSGRTATLTRLVEIATRLTGRRILPTFIRPHKGTITRTQASLDTVCAALGPISPIHVEQGLEETINAAQAAHTNARCTIA